MMNSKSKSSTSEQNLFASIGLFCDDYNSLGQFQSVLAESMPRDFQTLLNHEHHMTVTVEAFHESKVDLTVLDSQLHDHYYARKILLSCQSDGRIVQFGIVRLDLSVLGAQLKEEICEARVPLGRLLIQHNVLRSVQLAELWKVAAGRELCQYMHLNYPSTTFGRSAFIICNGERAIELLEIVTPTSL